MAPFKPVLVNPRDSGLVDPAYQVKDHAEWLDHLEREQLRRFENSLSERQGAFAELIATCEQYNDIMHWLGLALFRLIQINAQVGRNRYVPVRKYLSEVEFDVSQVVELALGVLWRKVKQDAEEEYKRQTATEIPF